MRNLADLKAMLKPGLTFYLHNYRQPLLGGEKVISEVGEEGFWYRTPGEFSLFYCEYPPPDLRSFDHNFFTVWRMGNKAPAPHYLFDFTQPEEDE